MDANTRAREAADHFLDRRDPPQETVRPTTGPRPVGFGRYLRERRAAFACAATEAALPAAAPARLGPVADEPAADAFRHASPDGRAGGTRTTLAADPEARRLTVEGNGAGPEIVGRPLGEPGGRLEPAGVAGGTRRVAAAPRRGLPFRPCCMINAAGDVGPADPG